MTGSIGSMSADDDITDELLTDAAKLTGLSLKLLAFCGTLRACSLTSSSVIWEP